MQKVIVITGQTAVGKTDISLELAKMFNSEIINCDASQFRRGLNIGTAKIDLTKTDVPHHLIDFLDPNADFSIKDFQELARMKIEELSKRDIIPFLVGGSGLYINSTLGDYDLNINGRNTILEEKYQDYTNEELHKVLEECDYQSSLKIHPNNRRRVLRAIEASFQGNKISENIYGNKIIYDALIICLTCERSLLYERINKRVDMMIEQGWVNEVINLKDVGVDVDHIKDIGYHEINLFLENKLSLEDAKTMIQQKTRNYAKRQMTWFKNKMNCHFINMDYPNPYHTVDEISKLISDFINK